MSERLAARRIQLILCFGDILFTLYFNFTEISLSNNRNIGCFFKHNELQCFTFLNFFANKSNNQWSQ